MRWPWRTGVAIAASAVVLHVLRDLPGRVGALEVVHHPWLSRGSLPYGSETADGWPSPWLYLAMPLVVAAAATLWIIPGFLATRPMHGASSSFRRRLIDAFGASFLLQGSVGSALFAAGFSAGAWELAAGTLILGGLLGLIPVKHSEVQSWPNRSHCIRSILTAFFLLSITITVLLPVLFWQDLNPDGFEVLHAGASLAHAPWPRWPGEAPLAGLGTGGITLAYPTAWFLAWFGPIDAAARLPLVLALPVLHAGLMELIAWKSVRLPRFLVGVAVAVALASVTTALVFSGGCDPHLPDAAFPAALDLLFLALMAGAILNLAEGCCLMTALLAALALFTRPTTVLILGTALVAGAVFLEEHRWRWVGRGVFALVLALAAGYLYEKVYIPSVLGQGGREQALRPCRRGFAT